MQIKVEKPTEQYLKDRNVRSWGIWEKEISRFDWHYDETEECYLLEGKVVVETQNGNVEFGLEILLHSLSGCLVCGYQGACQKAL